MYTNNIHTKHEPKAAEALQAAIVTARHGRGAPKREQQAGRIDRRRLHRVAVADNRVFTARTAPAPQKVRVTILVDASSSMTGYASRDDYYSNTGKSLASLAAQTCRNLAEATEHLEWVTADAVAFTTGYGGVPMYNLWKSGEAPEQIGQRFNRIHMGGTEEGYALAFAADEMKEHLEAGEKALVIIISDGAPGEPAHVKWVVDEMRREDIAVVSVALVESAQQPKMYGKSNVIAYSASAKKLARDMAKAIGRSL